MADTLHNKLKIVFYTEVSAIHRLFYGHCNLSGPTEGMQSVIERFFYYFRSFL